jgi:hypothetical protein
MKRHLYYFLAFQISDYNGPICHPHYIVIPISHVLSNPTLKANIAGWMNY